jgi:hypothetical protein
MIAPGVRSMAATATNGAGPDDRPRKELAMGENTAGCRDVSAIERCSVWIYWRREADEYKWIESERAGCDLGEAAVKRWVKEHWWGFLRARWIEHLHGARFWIELDQDDFGLILHEFHDCRPLLSEVVNQLKSGKENLDIINWAEKNQIPTEPIIEILERLNVNGHRIIHELDRC